LKLVLAFKRAYAFNAALTIVANQSSSIGFSSASSGADLVYDLRT